MKQSSVSNDRPFTKAMSRKLFWMYRSITGRNSNETKSQLKRARPIPFVVHVGAHTGQEVEFYLSLQPQHIVWIEANPSLFKALEKTVQYSNRLSAHKTNMHFTQSLVSSRSDENLPFHIYSNDGLSSSVYEPDTQAEADWPGIIPVGEPMTLRTETLDNSMAQIPAPLREQGGGLLVIDTQGHELDVLKGSSDCLKSFDHCICEISMAPYYSGGAKGSDVISFLTDRGFDIVAPLADNLPKHGDVLFRRRAPVTTSAHI